MSVPGGELASAQGAACPVKPRTPRCVLYLRRPTRRSGRSAQRRAEPTATCPLLPPQQFGIWLDSSSPEQTVPHLWSEESPASKPSGLAPLQPL